ncbi:MAG: hypothetical protein V4726_18855 [Verrucomicrobiota bacterium]
MDMIFRCCPRTGKMPGVQVRLSRVGSIYASVTASFPVWVGGRFWIAKDGKKGASGKKGAVKETGRASRQSFHLLEFAAEMAAEAFFLADPDLISHG